MKVINLGTDKPICPNPNHHVYMHLEFIEVCEEDETERKTAWTCPKCGIIVYVVEMK